MSILKYRPAIFVALGIMLLAPGVTTFGQSSSHPTSAKRTLITDPAPSAGKTTEQGERASKKESSSNSATTTEPESTTSSEKPVTQSIVGSGLTQPANQTAKTAWPQQPAGSFELFYKPIGATFLICAMAIGFLHVYRRYSGKGKAGTAPMARVLMSLPLGDKRSLAVVKVGHEFLVLGNTPNSITLLTILKEDPEAVRETQFVKQPAPQNIRQRTQPVQPIEEFTKHLKEEMDRKAQTRISNEPQFARVRQSLLGL